MALDDSILIAAILLPVLSVIYVTRCAFLTSSEYLILTRKAAWPFYGHLDPLTGYDFRAAEAKATVTGRKNAWYREKFGTLGKTFQVVSWGQRVLHTTDPTIFFAVLSPEAASYGVGPSRASTAIPWLGKGALTTDGDFWQQSRNLIKPIFNRAQISDLPRLERHLRKLIEWIPAGGDVVDLQVFFAKMYLDFSTEFLFGESSNTLNLDAPRLNAAKFIDTFDKSLLHVVYAQRTPWVIRWLSGRQRTWEEPFRMSQGYVESFIDAAIKRHETREKKPAQAKEAEFVFLDELMLETGSVDRMFLRGQMMNVFFPARDTSASGISLVFFQLAQHPEVWAKIRDEALEAESPITYEVVKTLRYAGAAINEALRLLSPGTTPVRTALQDCLLPRGEGKNESVMITRGTKIVMHTHAVQRDTSVWGAEASEYKPERWLEGDAKTEQRRAWEYLPFSGGPRICPAAQMMHTQFVYIVTRLAQEYVELKSRDEVGHFVEEHRVTMLSRNGVKVGLFRE